MSVWYLELDDEITDAVARLRAAKDDRVVLVVPPGSRIGTGRINFRLLAREAETRGLGIALVSGDAQVRALAASAGLSVFATVSESEAAKSGAAVADGVAALAAASATGPDMGGVPTTRSTAPGPGGAAAVTLPGSRTRQGDAHRAPTIGRKPRSRTRRMAMAGGAVALVALIGGGAIFGAYATTTATILLTQGASPLGPVTLTFTVAPDQASDPGLGIVAGRLVEIPLSAQGAVTATGSTTGGNRADGVVTFRNSSANPIPIPDQTLVATVDGIQFETQESIRVPPGASMDVSIRAVDNGVAGNVPANTIVQMAPELFRQLGNGTVTNKEGTVNGSTQVDPVILDTDFDSALNSLRTQLGNDLLQHASAPDGLEAGELVFPSTAAGSDVGTTPDRTSVVGQPVDSMPISASMTGSVLAVKQADLDAVAAAVLVAQAASGANLVDGSLVVDVAGPGPDPGTWLATATGRAFDDTIAEAALVDMIKGKTRSVAQGILNLYGSATITLSPDFMPTLPDDPQRISLTITKPPGGLNP